MIAVALGVILSVFAPRSGEAADHCFYDPIEREFICNGGGGGGGETDPGPLPTSYWTPWTLVGPCRGGGGAIGGDLIEVGTGQITAVRERYVDGEIVDTQAVCIDLADSADTAWTAISDAARALPEFGWESDPDSTISKGLTGLETWLWTSHGTQVGPISTTWTDAITGIAFAIEGRGWTETITWDTGDGRYQVSAATFDQAVRLGGTHADPGAAHTYEVTSADRGYASGYPVALELSWVGEYRVGISIAGGTVWTLWSPLASTLDETDPDTYAVVEVRSRLDD